MRSLGLLQPGEHVTLLCLGAHPDDLEIGAGGSILKWLGLGVCLDVHWCVATASEEREREARASAEAFLAGADKVSLHFGSFRDGFLPYEGAAVKTWVEGLAPANPDLILTPRREDSHQDHRMLSELTWSTFRDHLILEYEIPKWDGDLGHSNFYVPISAENLQRKITLMESHFLSQQQKDWFDPETFRGIARLRGMECRAPEHYAESFIMRKGLSG